MKGRKIEMYALSFSTYTTDAMAILIKGMKEKSDVKPKLQMVNF